MSEIIKKGENILYPKYEVIGKLSLKNEYKHLSSKVIHHEIGTIITVVDKDEDGRPTVVSHIPIPSISFCIGWWLTCSENGECWFPSTLLKLHSTSTSHDDYELDEVYNSGKNCRPDIFYAEFDWTGKQSDELSIKRGFPVEVIQRSLSGWWTARNR